MAEQNRSDLLGRIKSGQVVYVNGRSAATEAELDFALGVEEVNHRLPAVEFLDHGSNVVEVRVVGGSLEPGAIPGSEPNVVAQMSPAGTSATAVNGEEDPALQQGQPDTSDQPTGTTGLTSLTRAQLNARAAELGIADADKLANRQAVIDAITAKGGE
jgi:hypothetical protein